jgi:hypothetical protein
MIQTVCDGMTSVAAEQTPPLDTTTSRCGLKQRLLSGSRSTLINLRRPPELGQANTFLAIAQNDYCCCHF